MYKILIVDDEEFIRRSLVNILDWNSLGFSTVLQAENGVEALEIALREIPDLIVADIKMPFMDGLELTKIIKEKLPSVNVVILSGHDEFNLAQQALRLGVLDYIMKPLGAASMTEKIREIKQKLDSQHSEKQFMEKVRSQLYQSLPLLREQYLSTLVCTQGIKDDTENRLRFLEIPVFEGPFTICLIEPDFGQIGAEEHELYSYAIKNIATESVGSAHPVFSDSIGRIVILFSLSNFSNEADSRSVIFEIINAIQKSIEAFISASVTISVGTTVDSFSELYFSYSEALLALDCKYTLGKGKIYNIYDLDFHDSGFVYPFEDTDRFLVHVKSCQYSILQSDLAKIGNNLKSCKASPTNIKIVFIQIVTELLKILVETITVSEADWTDGLSIYSNINKLQTIEDIADLILPFSVKVSKCLSEAMVNSTKSLVSKSIDFIDSNFSREDLSLETVSAHVSVSSGYLSALFKKEAGFNFTDYLTKVRMDKAMELLRTTDLKTYQVAYNTGFSNPHYFSISFKKHTGKTPSEFRNSED
ncbi:MAG: response regulator [Saccharofermentanales bacterium]